jgi:hypothetical protein
MSFRSIVEAAVAALLLCGVSLAAPAAGGAGGEMHGAVSDYDAAGLGQELRVGAAELAVVPVESRALFAKVLDRLEGMRGEMEELKAGKARSDERAESMSVRITKLEETDDCEDTRQDLETGTDEPEEYTQPMLDTRRRAQAAPQACARVRDFQALSAAAMDACCPASGGGHRRFLQASCDLPAACPSAACAAVFVPYMQDCAAMLAATPGVPVADFRSFAASCAEMQAGAGQMLQPVAVQMFRVLVNTEGAGQAGSMFPGGGAGGGDGGAGQPLDPLQPVTPVPPSPPDVTEGGDETTGVTQYHAECTSADVASCVPPCNVEHHGFELLATIDGTDTKFSCNLAHGLYSWMGAASEGGYLGADAQSFFSAVVSGAAGSYFVTLAADAGIHTDLVITPGQDVRISGDPGLAVAPSWGSSFTVQERGSLLLTYISVEGDDRHSVYLTLMAGSSVSLRMCTGLSSTSFSLSDMGGGSQSFSSMTVPRSTLSNVERMLRGPGNTLQLSAVSIPENPSSLGAITWTRTVEIDGTVSVDDPSFGVSPNCIVQSGPCAVAEDGRCVGRPSGYGPSERCTIVVGGGGGLLGECGVFDTHGFNDAVTLPVSPDSRRFGSDCPSGVALARGDAIKWVSDADEQDGGGWQLCFHQ